MPVRVTEWTLLDATDGRDDLVVRMSRILPSAQRKMTVSVTSLDVRDVATGDGRVYLRLAPMPSSRPQKGPDFEIDGTAMRARSKKSCSWDSFAAHSPLELRPA